MPESTTTTITSKPGITSIAAASLAAPAPMINAEGDGDSGPAFTVDLSGVMVTGSTTPDTNPNPSNTMIIILTAGSGGFNDGTLPTPTSSAPPGDNSDAGNHEIGQLGAGQVSRQYCQYKHTWPVPDTNLSIAVSRDVNNNTTGYQISATTANGLGENFVIDNSVHANMTGQSGNVTFSGILSWGLTVNDNNLGNQGPMEYTLIFNYDGTILVRERII